MDRFRNPAGSYLGQDDANVDALLVDVLLDNVVDHVVVLVAKRHGGGHVTPEPSSHHRIG